MLSLVIPALNEEEAIQDTLRRAVQNLEDLTKRSEFSAWEVILVNDGSRDETLQRARDIPGVTIITYSRNRGYGLAIETGFAAAKGNLLAFMDADGTCDAAFLWDLWSEMKRTGAHVVIGNRLHDASKMPRVRRLGNTLYAKLLSLISGTHVSDTASGMRLIRRDALPVLHPLPKGLSYTPAMSAKCVLDPHLEIREIDMPYAERTGESKLNVVQDGLVFLQVILVTGVFYSPLRVFGSLAIAAGIAAVLAAGATALVSQDASLLSISVPLVILGGVAGLFSALGLIFHFFSKRILPSWPTTPLEHKLARVFSVKHTLAAAVTLALAGFCLQIHAALGEALSPALGFMWGGFLLYCDALFVLVAAGVFIVHQMEEWKAGPKDPSYLLTGTEIIRPSAE